MKILLITEFFPQGRDLRFSGGVEARTYFVGKHLAKKNAVYVICSHQPKTKRKENINGINVLRVGPTIAYNAGSGKMNLLGLVGFITHAIKEGKKIRPDIVDGGNFIAHLITKQISAANKIPAVFWYPDVFIGNWIKTSGIISGFGGWVIEKLNIFRGASKFIAISKSTKAKLKNQGVHDKKISVIPCGVDRAEFVQKTKKSGTTTIISISRLVKYKRIEDLVWAFANLVRKSINVQLLIVGEGPQLNKLENIIKMLRLTPRVTFRKNIPRNELVSLIKASHIFCLPSEIEGFGISVIESAAAGVPYVISDIPVFKEITNNGKGGLIFKLGNILDLTAKLEKLIINKPYYLKQAREAVKLAQNYSWTQISRETEKIYKSLL